jgi:hypothetical protein
MTFSMTAAPRRIIVDGIINAEAGKDETSNNRKE